MRPRLACGLVLALWLLSGCSMPQQAARVPATPVPSLRPTIYGVGVEPKTIRAGERMAVIHFRLSQPAEVLVDLVDAEGVVIRQVAADNPQNVSQTATWDGRDDGGEPVPEGIYRYVIRSAADILHDPSAATGGEELEPGAFTYDAATGVFRWTMPQAGWARLRIGLEGFPHLRTLLDWEPLEAGAQQLTWDGRDASGRLQLSTHPHLAMKLMVFSLPHNTVIVRGDPALSHSPPPRQPRYPPLARRDGGAFHAKHRRATCHEVRFRVEFPEAPQDRQGRFVLSGTVPVRVTLDERDAAYVVNQRYEVAFFEDLVALFEEEEGSNPLTYLWDTSHLTPGEHAFTVNILSYDDHFGVMTIPVIVREPS